MWHEKHHPESLWYAGVPPSTSCVPVHTWVDATHVSDTHFLSTSERRGNYFNGLKASSTTILLQELHITAEFCEHWVVITGFSSDKSNGVVCSAFFCTHTRVRDVLCTPACVNEVLCTLMRVSTVLYRDTSLIRNTHPPRITLGH